MYNNIEIIHKATNMTSAIAPFGSLRNRLKQVLSHCSRVFFFFSITPGTQTVNEHLKNRINISH